MTAARTPPRAVRVLAVVAALLLAACAPAPHPEVQELVQAEAAPADGDGDTPPATGWIAVDLPDVWSEHWPGHDGSVWYRLRWDQDTPGPAALLVDHATVAGEVRVNGSVVARDAALDEPRSRGWMQPAYLVLDAPLLRAGGNELLVRVAGYATFRPGLASVHVGEPAAIATLYRQRLLEGQHLHVADLAIRLVLAMLFGALWLSRRRESVYGWFALAQLAGGVYALYFLAPTPWPFADTRAWYGWLAVAWIFAGSAQALFLVRFAERRYPRVERLLGLACGLAVTAALVAPQWTGMHRDGWVGLGTVVHFGGIFWFLAQAWRTRATEQRVMAACLLLPVLASVHDFALFMGWLRGSPWLLSWTAVMTVLGIAFVLSHRFARARRRIEQFNAELRREVDAATARLGETLHREHVAALAHERADERLRLVRDLHDGFGGTLLAAIHRLRHAPDAMSSAEVVELLRRMREDLRLVIDSTAGDGDLAALLANVRHRADGLLEAVGVAVDWRIEGVDGLNLGGARSLDLLRLLQEALTNAARHSGARRLQVAVLGDGGRVHVHVGDDGRGLAGDGDAALAGTGLASLRQRAARLGGVLAIDTGRAGTNLRFDFPLDAASPAPAPGRPALRSPG